jgi:hypothetical protein
VLGEDGEEKSIAGDETGRLLVQCATILGALLDPGNDVVGYRKQLLKDLWPYWKVGDPSARTADWIDRCVSGTDWETPDAGFFKVHNRSMNFATRTAVNCRSRLQNENTKNIVCRAVAQCECVIVAPFALMFTAITAVKGSSLGGDAAFVEMETGRITLSNGLGLVQVGDISMPLHLVAFEGNVKAYSSYAKDCRTTKLDRRVSGDQHWPKSRALLRQDVYDDLKRRSIQRPELLRTYSCVKTSGSGSLLDSYRIVGACIDDMEHWK